MKNPLFWALNVVVLLGIAAECASAASEPERKASVFTKPAELKDLVDIVLYPARVESRVNATVVAESDGVVREARRSLGDTVKRDEVLFVIQHTDPVFRFEKLLVRAPISGVLGQSDFSSGGLVTKGQVLAAIIDPASIRLRIEVASVDLNLLKKGVVGEFTTVASTTPIKVEVEGVSPLVDANVGTASTLLKISTPSSGLVPGQVGRVKFELNHRSVYQVPQDAIVYRDEKQFLRILKDDAVQEVEVALGTTQKGLIEVTRGLHKGDVVVERASRYVKNGEKVDVSPKDGTP